MLTTSGVTHPGTVRKQNEDYWLADPELGLFIVADGMGGHNAGQVASALAVDVIRQFLLHTRNSEDFTWPYGIDPRLPLDANRLITSVKLANRRVFKTGEAHENYIGMGTTVVAAFIADGVLSFASVGDSRLYSFADGVLRQLTKDDTWVANLASELDQASLSTHPMRNVLTKAIGASEQLETEVGQETLQPGQQLLLCTDGVHRALSSDDIATVLREESSVEAASNRVVQTALQRNGSDNITALLVRYDA